MASRVPKLRVPLSLAGSSFATVEQNSVDEVQQCVEALVRTPVGTRIEDPEYGVADLTFRQDSGGIETDDYTQAITRYEPRAFFILNEEDVEEAVKRIDIDIDVIGGR